MRLSRSWEQQRSSLTPAIPVTTPPKTATCHGQRYSPHSSQQRQSHTSPAEPRRQPPPHQQSTTHRSLTQIARPGTEGRIYYDKCITTRQNQTRGPKMPQTAHLRPRLQTPPTRPQTTKTSPKVDTEAHRRAVRCSSPPSRGPVLQTDRWGLAQSDRHPTAELAAAATQHSRSSALR